MGMGISIMGSDFLAQLPLRIFISFARTKETKQRKFAGCTFLPTPALFCAKQKELATLKQLFVLTLRKAPPFHGKKVRPDLHVFYATLLRSLFVDVCLLFPICFARLLSAFSGEA